ncbi:MAG: hypothetical protein JNL50_00710 [Phycisphaerae bacterium]|nr:hypothetical protein [Phycisphaerae bacterium]
MRAIERGLDAAGEVELGAEGVVDAEAVLEGGAIGGRERVVEVGVELA